MNPSLSSSFSSAGGAARTLGDAIDASAAHAASNTAAADSRDAFDDFRN
jgi:hypothetical protein